MKTFFIHGMFCDKNCWNPLLNSLDKESMKTHLISLHNNIEDKTGRGFSDILKSAKDQIDGVIKESNEPFILVGHSVGSIVVEKLLNEYSYSRCILVNPSPTFGNFGPMYPLFFALKHGLFWRKIFRPKFKDLSKIMYQSTHYEDIDSAQLQYIVNESGELVRQAFWFFDLFKGATRVVRTKDRVVHIATGSLDPMGSPKYCEKILKKYHSSSTLEIIEGVDHMSIIEPKAINQIVSIIEKVKDLKS